MAAELERLEREQIEMGHYGEAGQTKKRLQQLRFRAQQHELEVCSCLSVWVSCGKLMCFDSTMHALSVRREHALRRAATVVRPDQRFLPSQTNNQQALCLQQAEELDTLHQQFQEEAATFEALWAGELQSLRGASRLAEEQLLERQLNKLAETKMQQAAAASFQPSFRASPALLNLRRIEGALAQQRQFHKAQQVQRRADELQVAEMAVQASALDAKQRIEDARISARQAKEQVRFAGWLL